VARNVAAPGVTPSVEPLVGRVVSLPAPPHVEYATVDTIRHFSRSCGDDNPLFCDEAYGQSSVHGGIIAPPLFPLASGSRSSEPSDEAADRFMSELRGRPLRVVEDRWTFLAPIRPSIRLERTDLLASIEPGAEDGALTLVVESRYEVGAMRYAVRHRTRRYGEPDSGPPADDVLPASYTEREIAGIDLFHQRTARQGATTRNVAQVTLGEEIGPLVKGPLTVSDLITYRAGVGPGPLGAEPLGLGYRSRQRHPQSYDRNEAGAFETVERRHWDVGYARLLGHPTAFDYSHTRLTWIGHLLTDWAGDGGWLQGVTFEEDAPNYVGDTHWLQGRVERITHEADHGRVDVSINGTNQRGTVTCTARATVLLPLPPNRIVEMRPLPSPASPPS
jgi:acyl dehydratase